MPTFKYFKLVFLSLLKVSCIIDLNEIRSNSTIEIQKTKDYYRSRILGDINTAELQWLEHLWNHEIMFETGVV